MMAQLQTGGLISTTQCILIRKALQGAVRGQTQALTRVLRQHCVSGKWKMYICVYLYMLLKYLREDAQKQLVLVGSGVKSSVLGSRSRSRREISSMAFQAFEFEQCESPGYLFVFDFIFNWRIIALQCCIGFFCTTV